MNLRFDIDSGAAIGLGVDRWLVERILGGWSDQAIAVATNVSLRTAKRWRHDFVGVETVVVAGWSADFAIRRAPCTPIRISRWERLS